MGAPCSTTFFSRSQFALQAVLAVPASSLVVWFLRHLALLAASLLAVPASSGTMRAEECAAKCAAGCEAKCAAGCVAECAAECAA